MKTDYLIALDTAQAELGDLYTMARRYCALRPAAEQSLLPEITRIGLDLRRLRRRSNGRPAEIEPAASRLSALRAEWTNRIVEIRESAPFRRALAALAEADYPRLARLIPEILAGHEVIDPPPFLYFPVRVSIPRKGPGSPAFSTSATFAERLIERLRAGIAPGPPDHWSDELRPIDAWLQVDEVDSPVTLRWTPQRDVAVVCRRADDEQILVFAARLEGPFRPTLRRTSSDDWWGANPEPYDVFRDRVAATLEARGVPVDVLGASCD